MKPLASLPVDAAIPLAPLLLAAALLLAPALAALPDDTTSGQSFWASVVCALVLAAALRAAVRKGPPSPYQGEAGRDAPTSAFLILLGLGVLSIAWRLVSHHGAAYLGLMLRGGAVLAAQFAAFALGRRFARRNRGALYDVALAAVLGAAYVSATGVNEYLLHVVAHQSDWRVFATSTPDYLAAYLVLLIPPTLALFLGAPSERRLPWLFGLVVTLEVATLLTTGSRFALVSLAVALIVFGAAVAHASRHGMALAPALRQRLAGIGILVALAAVVVAGPLVKRLHSGQSQANSGAFRVWTWKGATRMAEANPVLGAGIGAWVDTYPRYALTGFTRLAHSGYLQMADECGLPALLALLATLGLVGAAGARGLAKSPDMTPPTGLLAAVAPADDRLLLAGLLGGLAGGAVQNLIDSDWSVFFFGLTFWAFAGLTVGLARATVPPAPAPVVPSRRPPALAGAGLAGLLLAYFVTQSVAAYNAQSARAGADAGAAADAYSQARLWDPLQARYASELGYRIFGRQGQYPDAEAALRRAVALEPNGTNFRRLGTILDTQNKPGEAVAAYRAGLRVDPNSLDLRLALAKDVPPAQAQDLYRQIVALEDSPVGRVRAIGEVTEVKFAYAAAALGRTAAQAGSAADALRYDTRAAARMEAYADEGGTSNQERQVLMGSRPDPAQDREVRDLYAQVTADLARFSPPDGKAAVQARAQDYALRFRTILARDYAALGDEAADPSEALFSYELAAELLQSYADEGGSHSGQAQGLAQSHADPAMDHQMRDLYRSVMDNLRKVSPPDQAPALQAREQTYLGKFDALFAAH